MGWASKRDSAWLVDVTPAGRATGLLRSCRASGTIVSLKNEEQTNASLFSGETAGRLEIRLLGRFEVMLNGALIPPDSWRRRRPADLLKLLALAEGRGLTRERVVELLWPAKNPASGINNLHRALHDLRRILDARWVTLEKGTVRLRREAWLDVDAFEMAASSNDAAARQTALALYRGDLSPEDHESPWLLDRRDRLRRLHAQLLILQGAAPKIRGAPAPDGYDRAAHLLLGTCSPPPLRGRATTLGLVHSTIDQGFGTLVLLGERGVGTTRLAVEGARVAQERGAIVVSCTCGGPFGAAVSSFAEALSDGDVDSVLGTSTVSGASSPIASAELRKRLAQENDRRSLARIGAERPICLVVDDIHCADESAVDLFYYLAHHARSLKLMMIATCREDAVRAGAPIQTVLSDLDCEHMARGIRIQRLGLDSSREQIGDLLGQAPDDRLASSIYGLADGSPFFTEEIVRHLKESGDLATERDPAALTRVRSARLGPRAETLLAAAAVMGRRFDLSLVGPLSGLETSDAAWAVALCVKAGLLVENGAGHQFRHSLVREVLYQDLGRSRRAKLHQALADAIEARTVHGAANPTVELVASHRSLGPRPERVFRDLLSAGQSAAARSALREALEFLNRASSIVQAGDCSVGEAELFELFESIARVELGLGDLSSAARALDVAGGKRSRPRSPDASGEQESRLAQWASLHFIAGGNLTQARDALVAVAHKADDQLPCLLAELHWHSNDYVAAVEVAERCTLEAHSSPNGNHNQQSCEVAALARASPNGSTIAAAACAKARQARTERPFDVDLTIWERRLAGDRPRCEIEAALALYASQARLGQNERAMALARSLEGALALVSAQWERADTLLREAVDLQRASGTAQGEAFALERLGTLLTVRGLFDDGMDLLLEGVIAAQRGFLRRHSLTRLHTSLARNRLAAGAVYAAEDCIRQAGEIAAKHGECAICEAHFRPEAIRIALARGRVGEAEAQTVQLEVIAERRSERLIEAFARFSRGRVLAAQGRRDEAQAAVKEARESFAAMGEVFEAARCLTVEGHLLSLGRAVSGEPVESRTFTGAAVADV